MLFIFRDTVWGLLTGAASAESTAGLVMHEVREIETWILRLLSAPVPVPGKTRVEVRVLLICYLILFYAHEYLKDLKKRIYHRPSENQIIIKFTILISID